MAQPLRVLLIEDSEDDATLMLVELRRGGFEPAARRVDSAEGVAAALAEGDWDVVIADYLMPRYGGLEALAQVRASGRDIAFIVVSGAMGEELAVRAMKAGAHDYFTKDKLARLAPAVARELRELEARREAERRLQALSSRALEMQENERRRLAHELHDEIGQALTAVKIRLQALALEAGAAGARRSCDESIEIVDRALSQVRNLSLDLRPSLLDDLGLPAALRSQLDRQARAAGIKASFRVRDLPARLHPDLETACFRIFQEALTNVVRHARACSVGVELKADGASLTLSVWDDGAGFDVEAARRRALGGASLGIIGMEERALLAGGRIVFESGAPAAGTRLTAVLPLRARDAQ